MSLPNAITREDFYLNKIANPSDDNELPEAITRTQHYLKAIAENAANGGDALIVHVTKSGSTYTVDQTWEAMIAKAPNVWVIYDTRVYICTRVRPTILSFKRIPTVNGQIINDNLATLDAMVDYWITISASGIEEEGYSRADSAYSKTVVNNDVLTDNDYRLLQKLLFEFVLITNNCILSLSKFNADKTVFDFVNVAEGVTAHVAADKTVTITTT